MTIGVKSLLQIVLLTSLLCSCSNNRSTEAKLFNDNWQFKLLEKPDTLSDMSVNVNNGFDDGSEVALPHNARTEPMVVNDQWQGVCYYQKRFPLNKNAEGRQFIKFDAAMNEADVWLNGQHVAHHLGGYLPFVIDITDMVQDENLMIVRLDNRDNPTTGPKPLKELDYCTYGGLYRNVWLIEKNNVYISDPLEFNQIGGGGIEVRCNNVSAQKADVNLRANIVNAGSEPQLVSVTFSLRDSADKVVASTSTEYNLESGKNHNFESAVELTTPMLWSTDAPHMYTVQTEVSCNGKQLDSQRTDFGVRDIKIVDKKLYLNGEELFLRGINRHQEYPYVGYALSDAAQWRDAYKIKKAGFDYVRLSHYPQSEAFLDACDRLGLLVLDAISGWQFYGDRAFEQHAIQSAKDMIRRDRNHPSVLAWEVSLNETHMTKPFMQEITQAAKAETPHIYTAGWILDPSYDIYIESRQYRIIYPEIDRASAPLIVSEYGDWEYLALNEGLNQDAFSDLLPRERSSRPPRAAGSKALIQQALNIQESHNDNLKNTNALGDGYWVMFDYNRGYANDLEYSGIMDIFRLPKLSYYFYQSQRDHAPDNTFAPWVMKIAAIVEPQQEKTARLKVFSNCQQVELFVNGQSMGRQSSDTNEISTAINRPPFTFAFDSTSVESLSAIGYNSQGDAVIEDKTEMAGPPIQVRVYADVYDVPAQRGVGDVVFVYARIEDDKGELVYNYQGTVDFRIDGDAELVNDSAVQIEGGVATGVIKIGKSKDKIDIICTTQGLKEGALAL